MKKISHKDPFFIVKFPNGKQLLYRCTAKYWYEMNDIVKYVKDEFHDDTILIHVTKKDAKKFLKGKFKC